jgi:hypothetical protein
VAARRTCLSDALSDALKSVDPGILKRQLTEFVPADVQQILASAGVRDEHVFAVPVVIEAKPYAGGILSPLARCIPEALLRLRIGL